MQRMNYEVIRRLAAQTDATVIKWGHSQLFLPFFLLYAIFRSLLLLPKSRRPDVIYLGDALLAPLGLFLKKILRRPVAVTAHGRDLTFRFPLYRTKISFSLRRLDRVIGVSRHTTGLCRAMEVPPERCVTINNGVTPQEHVPTPKDVEAARKWLKERRFVIPQLYGDNSPSPCPSLGKLGTSFPSEGEGKIIGLPATGETRGFAPDRPIIMTVGRLVKRKGIARFVSEVLPFLTASFPQLLYIIVGEGKERKSIEEAITKLRLGGNVLLAGHLPHHCVRGLMGISKVFVMPNIPVPGDVEGFGIAALEASCAGLPVVASGIEGIRDAVVEGENGFLVPADDSRRFAAAIEMLLRDEHKRKDAGERARMFTAEHYSWDTSARRYMEELQKLANDAGNRYSR
jgi:phosphatidylinositol alpha-1,6-mannosyltransferase